ncbi:asparagine synthase (glutamine-hydrolyzing) [Psychroflexus sp. YR1-1]|uniref:asparagine synthase (glutamine-hydrolyzing) n=1 Tax=Psychroflexus aurantiacus TaxID=2709310 RepID=A0A6B3QYH3_9FLAO|nr:asparagine synthase (glutamine-hydrolyzing) [Psychroflexus aurantiacus]NEV92728.1 asparagine synthase (glutamine-hydrolyzing) [Psychroflexus aurantiacus]
MCGISGAYYFDSNVDLEKDNLLRMNNAIVHRGPDNGSINVIGHVGLGHRRLSILDLSLNGNQPMQTNDDRFTIVYNGEVYNFLEIKEKLSKIGYVFNSTTDTEVILKAFQEYGTACFTMLNGMFALAIYDNKDDLLYLCRDRFGIKPLYFYKDKDKLLFSSEIKAIKAYENLNLSLNYQALSEYLWFGNPLGNLTFYEQIEEVNSGTYIIIGINTFVEKKYFDINSIKENDLTENQIINRVSSLLEESVKSQLISDVPVGVFLSGGIDSSAITAFASKHYKGKLKTYSIGFDYDKGINELPLAKKIAEKFETEHHEIQISGNDLISVIESLVESHDEPFADAADIPLYLISEKLKGEVKVVLQGDGGDEFFGGYSRYNTLSSSKKWNKFSFISSLISLTKTENTKLLRLKRFLEAISDKKQYKRNALLLTMESKSSNPFLVLSSRIKEKVLDKDPFKKYQEVYSQYPKEKNSVQALFYTDAQIILKDTFFEKVDKSVMANSMEVRVPFIDNNLTDFMLSVPSSLKTKNGEQKYILKKALRGIVPDEVLDGKKKGFGVPYAYWLKTSLADYFCKQIQTKKVSNFIDSNEVLRLFTLHKNGKGNYGFLLWKVLILAIWLNNNAINE